MTLDPYTFIRSVTMSLGTFWTLRMVLRTVRFLDRWERRLEPLGIDRSFLRRQALKMLLRASILDPVNLALMLALVTVWAA